MKMHNPDDIVKSETFKTINYIIDSKVEELTETLKFINQRMGELVNQYDQHKHGATPNIRTRVSYETSDQYGESVTLPLELYSLTHLTELISNCKILEDEINNLQLLKLRLLNDYDFTHGDNTEQVKLFGEPTWSI